MTEKTSTGDASATTPGNNLPKAYDPSAIEHRWAEYWVRERIFDVPTPHAPGAPFTRSVSGEEQTPGAPGLASETPDDTSNAFTILLPPPNVTGRLHMGHMLNQTEMDILTRWHRMRGETSLWVPGTDHAGIATQMMVERQLASEGTDRKTLGREAFTERVWDWKHQYGNAITDQMRRLGASVDWSREYFTMDDRLSVAVKEAFVRLYEQGLIYRGAYIVNWDPILQTAVSDVEVESQERQGKLYHIRYPFADGSGSIVVATTRPETMFGDTAVAVNPDDERYKAFIGKSVKLPLTDREIPVIADDWAKPEFGTGAVKVTPAHDPNDFAIGQRHNLPQINIMNGSAVIELTPAAVGDGIEGRASIARFNGMDRFDARQHVIERLEVEGHLVATKEHALTLPISQRTGAVVEPRLSMQWFIKIQPLADKAIAAVQDGHIKFTPEMYSKTYMEWMNNIHDWCISRQLWWGHRIPAWHCNACQKITVSRETPGTCSGCGITDIHQSTDVLDTWFSSGLLPFTVFGWPGTNGLSSRSGAEGSASTLTTDLAAFYPTTLLVTGFDILFFWVARMIMLGCHFMLDVPMPDGSPRTLAESVPFKEVYIHGLVRDANREKMSKTKGNVINPIEIIERFGTDAVRFTLASQASPGTDIAFNEARTEGYRAFANKIWNAARFLFMNLDRAREAGIEIVLPGATGSGAPFTQSVSGIGATDFIESRWILARLSQTAADVDAALSAYRFDEAASHVYQFFWGELCDWYLEIVKLRLNFEPTNDLPFPTSDDAERAVAATTGALNTLVAVFEAALRLLSPFMPFITEEIWHALYQQAPPAHVSGKTSIALTRFPQPADFPADEAAIREMTALQELIVTVRALRKELGVPEKHSAPIRLHGTADILSHLEFHQEILDRLARVSAIEIADAPLTGADARSTASFDVAVVYERQIDVAAERERLTKELAKHEKTLAGNEARLADEKFTAKAPAHIVEGLRKQTDELRILRDKAQSALDALPQ